MHSAPRKVYIVAVSCAAKSRCVLYILKVQKYSSYTMKESVAIAKGADAKKGFLPTNNSIHRVRDESERQLGSLRSVIANITRNGGTPSSDSIATELSGVHTAQRAPALLALQQTHGNRYVQRVVAGIQAKLVVGQPGDKYEQEADRVADAVMQMPEPEVQRQPEEEEEETLQAKPLAEQITPLVQRQVEEDEEEEEPIQTKMFSTEHPILQKQEEEPGEEEEVHLMTKSISGKTPQIRADLYSRLNRNGGQPLPEADKSFMERRFSTNFSGVRVHTDSNAIQMNKELNAQAFTHGRNIYFGTGRYRPGTSSGKRLLAHELTHVIQQGGTTRSFHDAPAHSSGHAKPLRIMRSERDIIMRSLMCPNTVMTFCVDPISERFNHPSHGRILLLGGIARMEVGENLMCVSRSFDGERLTETVTIRSNTCRDVQTRQSSGGTFTVGSGSSVGSRRFPPLQNTFYDHHEMGMLDNPDSMRRWRSRNCQIVRDQRYSCGGVTISSHEITTTFRPVSSGDPNVTVVKRDINSCLPCGRRTP